MQDISSNEIIRVRKLCKAYNNKLVLNNINLNIPKSSGVIALLGHNGAGKTSLINCLLGLSQFDSGQVRVFNKQAGSIKIKSMVGAMLQDTDLPDLLTPREHLTLFASYYSNPIAINELIDTYDLTEFSDQLYKKLSGGQKRRVQMAIALIGQGELLFLDEPTNGLDAASRRQLWTKVKQLADQGKTIFLSTHYLEEADALAERIIVLHQGKIIADAPTPLIRQKLGGSIIRCVTKLSHKKLTALTTVNRVQNSGRFVSLHCSNEVLAIQELLKQDSKISELSISKPGLEEILENLALQESMLLKESANEH